MSAESPRFFHHYLLRRVEAHRASRSFGSVLTLIVVAFVFAAAAPDTSWAASVLLLLESVTLIAALWTSGLARADSWLSLGLLAVAVGSATALLVTGGSTLLGIVAVLSAVLSVGVVLVLARSIVRANEVNAQSITGAICIYLLIGMIFLFAYGAVTVLDSSAFFAQGTDGTRALRLYFSYVTLATLGYGDYTPATNLGHMLAIAEALIGQLYLVTVVAVLVTRLRIRRSEP
jgi:Ion channel